MTSAGGVDVWRITGEERVKHDSQFFQLKPVNGFITGEQARGFFMQSGLQTQILGQIWTLADMNGDGKMDKKEFSIAMHLIKKKLQGYELPKALPPTLKADPSPVMGSFGTIPGPMGTMSMAPVGIGFPAVGMVPPVSMAMGVHTVPMMTNGIASISAAPVFMGGGVAPATPATGWAGSGTVTATQSPAGGMALPHQSKLKYTQVFNANDRNKRGFLTGVEARAILVQSGVPQPVLAQIWSLSDVDRDGQLTCDEFCIAMHLIDIAKMGQALPPKLPPELLPPSTKGRAGSFTNIQGGAVAQPAVASAPKDSFGDLLGHMGMTTPPLQPTSNGETKVEEQFVTFEDRRKENFDKGQAELDKRRQMLADQLKREEESRREKERQEEEKRERIRQDQERRRLQELERQLEKQRELEREREEHRRKMMEQRDAARKELERQRQMEWERQRKEQLLAEKTREYQQFMSLKSQTSNLKCELESLEGKKNEINQKISQVRKGVMDFTASIESMRSTRDIKLAGMEKLQKEFQEINSKLQQLQRDREQLNLKVQTSVQSNPISETHRTMMHSVELKKTTVQRLRKDLEQIDKDKELKILEKDKFNLELKELNTKIGSVQKDLANLQKLKQQELNQSKQKQEEEERVRKEKEKQYKLKELEAQRLREEEERKKKEAEPKATSSTNWFDFGGDAKGTSSITDNWPSVFNNQSTSSGPDKKEAAWDAAFSSQTTDQKKSGLKKKYKALFQFDARNVDELSLLPGDIVLIPEDQSGAEPGWMNGEKGGKTGYFPEAYVQPLEETEESSQSSVYEEPLSHHIPTISTSEESSFTAVPGRVPVASPTPGQGKTAPDGLQAQALYVWKAKKDNHLSFNKGDIINVREQQDMWWSGEISGKVGWFPKSYVKLTSGPSASSITSSSPAMTPSITLDKASSAGSARGSPALDKKEGEQYVSIYNYQSSEAGDLTFNQGEIILVTKCEGDWWTGSVGDKTGIFPATYVKKMETPQLKQVPSAESFDITVESLKTSLESAFSQLDSVGSGLNWGTFDNDPFSKEDPFSNEDPFTKDNFGDDEEDHLYDMLDDVLKSQYSNEMFPEASTSATADDADLFDLRTQKTDSFSALKNVKSSDLNDTDPSNLAEISSELEIADNEDGLYETFETVQTNLSVQTKDTSFTDDSYDLYEGIFKEGIFKDGEFINASPLEVPQPLLDNGINTKKSTQTPPASLSKDAGLEGSVRNWAMSIFDESSDASLGAEVAAAFSGSAFGSKTLDIRDDVDSVEIDAQSSMKALGATSTLKKPEIATVIASYTATGNGQLSLQPGQLLQVRKKSPSGWWEGELQARGQKRQIGWFPANYVKLLSSGSARSTPDSSRGISPALVPSGGGSTAPSPAPARPPSSKNLAIKYVDHVVALYPYGAQNEDELTFPKDAVINVVSKEDADWWQGEFNGQVGMFPSNYVSSLGKDSPSWSTDPQVLATTSTEEGKRQNAVHELINTEEVYVSDLSTALDAFYNPLATAKAMTEEELQAVFVNWHDLRICNTKLNKAFRVRKKIRNGQVIEVIGDILCEYLPHMSPYIRFCSCQLNAAALLQRLSESRPLFNEIHKKCVQNPKTKGMPLSSFLLKPMQRITKYPLLIEKILKYTPEGHPDHQHLTEALAKAEELCNQVNEGVREKENSDRLEQLQKLVVCDGLPEKITFNSVTNCLGPRKLVHSGVLYKSKSNKELVVFLFNDFLLLTQANRPVGSMSSLQQIFTPRNSMHFKMYKTPLVLNEVMIKKPTEDDADPCQFQLNQVDRLYHFKCSNQNERDTWLKKIEATIKSYQDTERKKREKAHSLRRSPGVGRLLVVILEGADLQASDENGKSDPYCEVSMGAQEHRTKVIPATLNPKWNQSMQFTIRDMEQDVLCITVFDRDLFSPNDFLGRTEKRVKDIHNSIKEKGPGPVTERLLLHEVPTGEVVVKFDLQLYDTT